MKLQRHELITLLDILKQYKNSKKYEELNFLFKGTVDDIEIKVTTELEQA